MNIQYRADEALLLLHWMCRSHGTAEYDPPRSLLPPLGLPAAAAAPAGCERAAAPSLFGSAAGTIARKAPGTLLGTRANGIWVSGSWDYRIEDLGIDGCGAMQLKTRMRAPGAIYN